MADNLSKTEWDAGAEVASDDIAGIHYPRVKLTFGADGTATDPSAADPFPVGIYVDTGCVYTTSTPLGISATATSTTFDAVVCGSNVTILAVADQTGTIIYEESINGTTWDIVDSYPYAISAVFHNKFNMFAQYARVRFVNNATAQGVFRFQVIARHVGAPHSMGISSSENTVAGDKTHNTSAPTAEAFEVIGAVAKAAAPTYTEGAVVMPRVTLSGDQAVTLDGEAVILGAGTAGIGKLTANSGVDIGDVDVLSMPAVTQATASALNAQVVGDLAHDAIDSVSNPIKIGGKARNANPTSVANNDRVDATFDLGGRQIVKLGNPRGLFIQNTITLTTTTETTLLAAAASTFHDLTCLFATNSSATAVRIDFRDTTAGTVRFSLAIAANGGAVIPITYPIEQTAVNTNWTAQLSGAVTDIRIFAQAVKNVA